MNQPAINVTPLIDVLLVLLIIFMVITPTKPSGYNARIPQEQKDTPINEVQENPKTIVISVDRDGNLRLNNNAAVATLAEPEPVSSKMIETFNARIANGDVSDSFADDADRPFRDRIERTVFVKAQKNVPYGVVVKAVDIVKSAGAYPISLQIDNLND